MREQRISVGVFTALFHAIVARIKMTGFMHGVSKGPTWIRCGECWVITFKVFMAVCC